MLETNDIFRHNVVFGTSPIGCPSDISLRLIQHIKQADIILVESHREFSRLMTHLFESPVTRIFDTQTYATIYQYDLHSDQKNIDEINSILFEESKTKKILVLSDEGSSIFLEPASELKSILSRNNIPFQYIPGPNSVITGICVSRSIVNDFYFGGSLPPVPKKKRLELFRKIKDANLPTIFLLTAVDTRDCVEDAMNFFGDQWNVELLMNLTMDTEKTMLGSFRDILAYIDENSSYFERDEPHKKFAMNVFPLQFTRYTSPDYYYDQKRGKE